MAHTLECFCIMCKNDFIYNLQHKEKAIICPICNHSHDVYEISAVLTNLKKELKRLLIKHIRFYYVTRVEFEQDYKMYLNINQYFLDAVFQFLSDEEPERISPPRFDIVAYQFKTKDDYRFLLHSNSINPNLYDISAYFNFNKSFEDALQYPHWHVYPEDSKQAEVTLFDFANLACMTKLYSSYYQLLSKKKGIFFYPILLGE